MSPTPRTLLERLRDRDDPDARSRGWSILVDLYAPVILLWAKRLGANDADARDLVQEVFAKLVTALPDFRHDGRSFRGWLFTVTRNTWADLHRKRVPMTNFESADASTIGETEQIAEAEHQRLVIRRALEIMKRDFQPTSWRACWETIVEDRPADEVAAELGLPSRAAVYAATRRVLQRLREELAELMD